MSTWRTRTVRGLQAPSAERELASHSVHDQPRDVGLRKALADIVRQAIDVCDISQRDVCTIVIDNNPDVSDSEGWIHDDGDLFRDRNLSPNLGGETEARAIPAPSNHPVYVFPRAVRMPSGAEASQYPI